MSMKGSSRVGQNEYEEDLMLREFDGVFYTEISTRLIYEAQLYEDFILVRPASPAFRLSLRKLSYPEFAMEFDEFLGNHDQLRAFLRGQESSGMSIL